MQTGVGIPGIVRQRRSFGRDVTGRDFISIADLSSNELESLITIAADLKTSLA